MLSILIPVFNYNISNLVNEVHKQASETNIEFEIICLDDCSHKFLSENKSSIEALKNVHLIISEQNNGRTKSRKILCNKANYDWLLFLDADVFPKNNTLIADYIKHFSFQNRVVFGGIVYDKIKPVPEKLLRWKYGRNYEETSAQKRNSRPYKNIVSANFIIKKEIFKLISNSIKITGYGLDNYFGALLKHNKIKVLHIDNEVFHLGIEENQTYLNKIEQAAETLLIVYNEEKINYDNSLLNTFLKAKRMRINYLLAHFYTLFGKKMQENLLSQNPNLFCLQLYKLSYLCFKEKSLKK